LAVLSSIQRANTVASTMLLPALAMLVIPTWAPDNDDDDPTPPR
jgi:hypothetical protein